MYFSGLYNVYNLIRVQVELLFSLTGTAVGGNNSVAIQAALQHSFRYTHRLFLCMHDITFSTHSQGRIYITSSDPFDYPAIDPQYFSHPAGKFSPISFFCRGTTLVCTDALLLREGLKLARKLGQTQPLNASISSEVSPGASVSTDADWDAWIPGQVGTEWVFIYVVVV